MLIDRQTDGQKSMFFLYYIDVNIIFIAYRSREDLYSDKIAIGEKKVCPLFAPKPQAQYWHVFDENSIFLFYWIDFFFGRNLLFNYSNNVQKLVLIIML